MYLVKNKKEYTKKELVKKNIVYGKSAFWNIIIP